MIRAVLFVALALVVGAPAVAQDVEWTPAALASGVLPDYSFAGYRWGEEPVPTPGATVVRATDHGVVPDDGRDDTAALRAAVAEAGRVEGWAVVELPAGKVELRNLLFIERDSLVLRGAGSGDGGTVLSIPVPMREMDQPPVLADLDAYLVANDKTVPTGEFFSPYSWTGGVIWTRAPKAAPVPEPLAAVVGGVRGAHTVTVDDASAIRAGDVLRFAWVNRAGPDSPLLQHLYGMATGLDGDRLWESPDAPLVTQEVTVASVDGDAVTVREPLLHDLRPEWSAVLAPEPRLRDVGIEGIRIVFPDVPYPGHHQEAGYNAIYLTDLRHGWVRDVAFVNADSGILSDRVANVTLAGITVEGRDAHYGVHLGDVERVLLTDFETTTWAHHPVSFNTGARQSVITGGRVVSPQLDRHRGANHTNLYDDLDAVEPSDELRLFTHGGAGYWGPAHGVGVTFWNVRLTVERPEAFAAPVHLGGVRDSSRAHVVGLTANVPVEIDYPGAVVEGTNRPGLGVRSLYAHQLHRRLARR
ncbi:hypothetical protein [Rubrivirga marina]|uniref:Pectate lyase superfamily protein domain-containing protein n=1 Tax=Rubrivirga marina TaxID=1196024 RepID=A0A271IXR7_9BACT|nr:hypothetical protein [Rubrivirga marina]PAP75877.1 hypothetical protein BSZ37_05190 [Rubrivirga marina]